jgi:radical SAM/Cys-rich protein
VEQTIQLKMLGEVESFKDRFEKPIKAYQPEILQLNIIRKCNLNCKHCHVDASPNRKEIMPKKILRKALEIAKTESILTIDVTGGSPEMNPHFEWFLDLASKLGKKIIVRTNLVILKEKKYRGFLDVYTKYKVELCGSLPNYVEEQSDRQRGYGSFGDAVEVIKKLNEKGYGKKNTDLILNLVHNPVGAYLPGPQSSLEHEYKTRLFQKHGVVFNHLFCITNMPIGRFMEFLLESGNYQEYMTELVAAFNPSVVENLMCRKILSVAYDGTLYDCDFNQMLSLPIREGLNILDLDFSILENREIILHNHCWGCTAGCGSSCQGTPE